MKPLAEQVNEVNEILRTNGVLVFAALLVTFLAGYPAAGKTTPFTGLFLGSVYLLSLFLLALVEYQLYKSLNFEIERGKVLNTLKNLNYVLYTVVIILFIVWTTLLFDYGAKYLPHVANATGFAIAMWISPFLLIAMFGLPILFASMMYELGKQQTETKYKILIYASAVFIMVALVPIAIYLIRREPTDLLLTPVFAVWMTGISFIVLAIKDMKSHFAKKKEEKHKEPHMHKAST